ncbi:unnamed protein product [Hyaloperonospora brassicae]|uniref:Uncharacterized protein n=1 Tax=Hyaloperonospora brassicae TaxID=162125 RepID=A0AAV0TLD6_HYABA|nr:unnamed protein product [Hyaloperonospora brassicae]
MNGNPHRARRDNSYVLDYGLNAMPLRTPPTGGFLEQLQNQSEAVGGLDGISFDVDVALRNQNRNRGNYRCSKCGEPKKGHVCPLVPSNFKCNRCGLSKKACSCTAPKMCTVGVQVEMDHDMTTRVLDLSVQGMEEAK